MTQFKSASLTPATLAILHRKETEYPHTGQYCQTTERGTYLCRQCGLALFRSSEKFRSHCGWPSFDDAIPSAVTKQQDADGIRTEIICYRCSGHLGHVFEGEGLTAKNVRYCVNSLALDFVLSEEIIEAEEAIYAAGCFWGVEHLLRQHIGVVFSEVGYSGGTLMQPHYDAVCTEKTGHLEAVRILFDPSITHYEALTKDFFCIHDPTQIDGQGPDKGEQYKSAIFFHNETQHHIAQALIAELKAKGLSINTALRPATVFWPAESYHQNYYGKNHQQPYCHRRVQRF